MSVQLLIAGVRASVDACDDMILNKAKEKMKRAGIDPSSLHFRLYKKSIDARKKEDIRFECSVLAEGGEELGRISPAVLQRADAKIFEASKLPVPVFGSVPVKKSPLVVGMGPAGLFAALLLAKNGYAPILIDRGDSIRERERAVEAFRKTGVLDAESNIQFGAGGAGTFSDGKLVTRINDSRCAFVLETLHRFGAPDEILYKAKPHVGTDVLRRVVSNMLEEIERLGGTLIYRCCMQDMTQLSDGTVRVQTSRGEMHCGAVILAIGHSARDTYSSLIKKNYAIEPKPISVGVRVEHLQSEIDQALYGRFAGHPNLGPGEYSLSDTKGKRGVYTFCMCPGGEVVAAASEHGHLVVNGMSYHARSGANANAAVAVSVSPSDFEAVEGSVALGAIDFQRRIERAAFLAGGGDYYAPVTSMKNFLEGGHTPLSSRIQPSYRGGLVREASLDEIFPSYVTESLRYGFASFGKKIRGYDAPDAILTAAETRTSAPLRILRDAETLTAVGNSWLYPCGEGAGYAGGITSAAVDGIRSAYALMARFLPKDSM